MSKRNPWLTTGNIPVRKTPLDRYQSDPMPIREQHYACLDERDLKSPQVDDSRLIQWAEDEDDDGRRPAA
jgi:hypothetical protein